MLTCFACTSVAILTILSTQKVHFIVHLRNVRVNKYSERKYNTLHTRTYKTQPCAITFKPGKVKYVNSYVLRDNEGKGKGKGTSLQQRRA